MSHVRQISFKKETALIHTVLVRRELTLCSLKTFSSDRHAWNRIKPEEFPTRSGGRYWFYLLRYLAPSWNEKLFTNATGKPSLNASICNARVIYHLFALGWAWEIALCSAWEWKMAPNQSVIWTVVISGELWETENNFVKWFCLETADDQISSLAQAEVEILCVGFVVTEIAS